jgi:outer membrane protein insertion porin family
MRADFARALGAPLVVSEIRVEGAERTRTYVVERELLPCLEAETLEELRESLLHASRRLEALGIFRGVDITADAGPEYLPNAAAVIATVDEANCGRFSAGSFIQGGDVSVEVSGASKNRFGHAEGLEAHAELSHRGSNSYWLSASLPRLGLTDLSGEVRAFQETREESKWSSFSERTMGALFQVGWGAADGSGGAALRGAGGAWGRHDLGYQLSWGHLRPGQFASPAVQQQGGHSLKSAMKHVYLADRRVPLWWGGRSGAAFRSEAEIAGVGPDANLLSFFRQQVDVQVSLPLTEFTSLHLGAHCGALLPLLGRGWGRGRPQSPISERFFMGGIGNLRGFRFKGVGPSDARKTRPAEEGSSPEQPRRDALGGDLACSSFAAYVSGSSLGEVLNALNGELHGPVHIMIGGHWGMSDEWKGLGNDMSFDDKFLLLSKWLWRQGFVRTAST